MADVVVVGAGLFGSIITRALRAQGADVVVVADTRFGTGSKPAACLMKPGWFAGMGKTIYKPALACLDELYGLRSLEFKVGLIKTLVHWVPPSEILLKPDVEQTVTEIASARKGWRVICSSQEIETKRVVVAAGIWSQSLVPGAVQKGMAGIAFLWPKAKIAEPFIRLWAPYRQVVVFNRGDGVWASDGTASVNWKGAAQERDCFERCTAGWDVPVQQPASIYGIRPYYAEGPCLLKEFKPGLWVTSGGAKNGTVAAGWCAHVLVERFGK